MTKIVSWPSANYGPRRSDVIDMLVLHYTGMVSTPEALARLADPQAEVSSHYLIDEDGTIFTLVPEDMRAWHAGRSFWRGETDVNSRSIGIELSNPGHEFGYRPFPKAQIDALIDLSSGILSRHPIPARNVVGHSDVAPSRKTDPGEFFPWHELAARGIGLWPEGDGAVAMPADTRPFEVLAAYGYDVSDQPAAVAAFQRHFHPERMDAILDGETLSRLLRLLASLA